MPIIIGNFKGICNEKNRGENTIDLKYYLTIITDKYLKKKNISRRTKF